MNSGSIASARAIPTRWRWPPDISWGSGRRISGRPAYREKLAHASGTPRGIALDPMHHDRLGDDLADLHARLSEL
jgi:hypothetical protein